MAYSDRPYYNDGYSGGGGARSFFRSSGGQSVIVLLIVANIVMFFVDGFASRIQTGQAGGGFVFDYGQFNFVDGVLGFQIWRFVSYQFLHAGLWHLAINMLYLFWFGRIIEAAIGPQRFLGYYLLCGMSGAVLYLVLLAVGSNIDPEVAQRIPFLLIGDSATPLVGASGAIFGVMVACLVIAPGMEINLLLLGPVKMWVIVWVFLLVNLYIVMISAGAGGQAAHLGGAMLGAILIRKIGWLSFCDRLDLSRFSKDERRLRKAKKAADRQLKGEADQDRDVDRILEKVHQEGINSLTNKEKCTLQEATDREKRTGR